jgi:predicted dehydrogenase
MVMCRHTVYILLISATGSAVGSPKSINASRRMIEVCRHANVKLMIGYRTHYDATFRKLYQMVRSGELGEIQAFQGGFFGMKNKQQWRLDRALAGGGSLLDLGIYPLNTMRWFSGEEFAECRGFGATRDKGPAFTSVEQSIDWLVKFPSGILGSGGSSYGQSGTNFIQINGTAGHVRLEPAFVYGDVVLKYTGVNSQGQISGGGPVTDPDQFVNEVTHFSDCALYDRRPDTPGEEGLAELLAIEAIYQSANAPIA